MLEVEESVEKGVVYLSKSTYDQALLLFDRMEGELSYLKKALIGTSAKHSEAIDYFYNSAPEPLNILAPYLGLIRDDVELETDIRSLCGALHMMSMIIDFNEFAKVPAEVRANVDFSKSTVRKYEQSWKDMEVKLKVADIDLETISVEAVASILQKFLPMFTQVSEQEVSTRDRKHESSSYEEDEELNPENEDFDFFKALELRAKKAEERVAAEEASEAENNEVVWQDAPKEYDPVVEEKKKELSEIDNLINTLSGIK